MNVFMGKKSQKVTIFVITAVSLVLACFVFLSTPKASAIPTTMNFQGRLGDASGNTVANGLYNMQFKLYTVSTGGSTVWNETRETTNRVQVTNGLFSTKLGEVSAIPASLFASGNLYFEITLATPGTATCNTASCASWESPMTPRHQMSTSAYAFNSETLDGLDSTAFAASTGSANYIQNTGSPQTANFNITGTGTAALLQAATLDRASAGTLTLGGTNATSIALSDNTTLGAGLSLTLTGGNTASRPGTPSEGMVYYDTTTKQLVTYANGKWQQDRTDAVLVAGSNSSQTDKDIADYVADGNTGAALDGDQVQINSALTAASGKKVVLLAGTYTVDASVSVPNNTILTGVGNGTLVTVPNTFNANINVIANADTTTGTGVSIRDLKIDGNKANQSSGNMVGAYLNKLGDVTSPRIGGTLANVTVTNFNFVGIQLEDSDNNTVSNVTITNNDIIGLYLNAASTNKISNATVYGNSTGINLDATTNTGISDSTFTANTAEAIILSTSSNSNTISGNTMSSNSIAVALNTSDYNTVTGNTMSSNPTYGVQITGSNRNTVSTNTIYSNGGATANNAIYVASGTLNTISSNTIADTSCTTTCYAINLVGGTSTSLSDNVFSGTGSPTINDTGTTTIYAGQAATSGGLDLRFKQAASTTAFQVQNALAAALLTADSSNYRIQIGSSTTDAVAIMFALDQYNQGTDPTGLNGGMYYNTNTSKFRCYQNGAWADCITTDTIGANTTLSNLGSTNINAALNATSANLTLQTTTSGNIILNAVGTTELQDDTNVGGNLTIASTKSLRLVGGTTAQRPGSPTEGMMFYDTDTKQLLTYANGKWQADRSEAVMVAANNSSDADKAAADYIADGTADQTEINNALIAANPAGSARKNGKVYLFAGTYSTTDVINIPNNTSLAGSGRGTLIQFANIAGQTKNMISNTDTTTGEGITIRDIRLDGNKSVNTTGTQQGIFTNGMGANGGASARQGATITNVWVNNFNSHGIYLLASSNGSVLSSASQGNTGDGVMIDSSNRVNVSNNIIQGNSAWGIHVSGALAIVVNGNNVANNGTLTGTNSSGGIVFDGTSQNNAITNNAFRDNGSGSGASNPTIYIVSSSNNTITGNSIADAIGTTGYAIYVFDAASSGNYFASNSINGTFSSVITNNGTNTVFGGQLNGNNTTGNYLIQPAGTIELMKNTNVTGTLTTSSTVLANASNSIDIGSSSTTWRSGYFGTALYAPAIRPLADSATAIKIQNAAGSTDILTVNSSANTVIIGSTSNGVTIGSSGISLAGTARPDVTVTFNPEYSGATFTGDGTNNNGSLSSDYCSGSSRQNINAANCGATETHNYYNWTTTQASAQDYDIYVRYQLPSNYATGSMVNMKIFGWGTTAANESLTVALQVDSAAGDCSTSSDVVTSNTTWQSVTVASPLGSCTPVAGDIVSFKVKVTAGQNNTVRAGAISFGYKQAF